jgi:hypothetical protein
MESESAAAERMATAGGNGRMNRSELGDIFSPQRSAGFDSLGLEQSLRRGEREKQLEILLQKAKRDKDKAIRLIVQIVGKVRDTYSDGLLTLQQIIMLCYQDRISSFLTKHAGAPDILDRLLEYFSSGLSVTENFGNNGHNSPPQR